MFLVTEELKCLLIKNSQLSLHLEKSQHAHVRTLGKHQIFSCSFQDNGEEMTIGHKENESERKQENKGDKAGWG